MNQNRFNIPTIFLLYYKKNKKVPPNLPQREEQERPYRTAAAQQWAAPVLPPEGEL